MNEAQLTKAIRGLFEACLGKTGEKLIASAVSSLRDALEVDWVYVASLSASDTMTITSGSGPEGAMDRLTFKIHGTPCEAVLKGSNRRFADGVACQFPESPAARNFGAQSYCGEPIVGAKGGVLAVLAAAHSGPMPHSPNVDLLLKMAAQRIGTELERDFTERHARRRHRMESLGLLAGKVAHDFNNHLTSILANVSLARMQLERTPATGVAELLDEIETAGKQASTLTRQLTTFAGRGKTGRSLLDLVALVRETCAMMSWLLPTKISIQFRPPEEPFVVHGDGPSLRQVVLELLRNAIESMAGRSGTIQVALETCLGRGGIDNREAWIAEDFDHHAQQVVLTIADEGCGIEPGRFESIFTPLVAGKATRRGFGLSVSASITSRHSGCLSLSSVVGVGTVASLFLPRREAVTSALYTRPFEGTRILVADDEPLVRAVLGRALRSLGCTVIEAEDGAEALRLLKTGQKELDCAILDVFMPHMGGDRIANILRSESQRVPIILSSGMLPEDLLEYLRTGAVAAALQKPCTTSAVEMALRAAVPARLSSSA